MDYVSSRLTNHCCCRYHIKRKGGVVHEEKIEYRGEEPPTSFVQFARASGAQRQAGWPQRKRPREARAVTPKTEDKPKKEKKQDAAPASTETDIAGYSRVSSAWVHPEADKLYCEMIDIKRRSRLHRVCVRTYELEGIEGKCVPVLTNLKSRKTGAGFASHGMVSVRCDRGRQGAICGATGGRGHR
jgi:tRNA-binding EMAP/Myf-like protein